MRVGQMRKRMAASLTGRNGAGISTSRPCSTISSRTSSRSPSTHIAVTGDLVNLSLSAEFPQAYAFLERTRPPARRHRRAWQPRHLCVVEAAPPGATLGRLYACDATPADTVPQFPFVAQTRVRSS